MSISENYRECIVKVNNGSGCLVQPGSDEYTYIFTAKHVLYDQKTNKLLPINISEHKDGVVFQVVQHFEHENKEIDAVVLLVKKIPEFKSPVIENKTIKKEDKFVLCGFPGSRNKKNPGEKLSTIELTTTFDNDDATLIIAQTMNLADHKEVEGFSGGGIFKEQNNSLFLQGIQSEMDDPSTQNGKINFINISVFLNIIKKNNLPGLSQKVFTTKETARELVAVVKKMIAGKLHQPEFSSFLECLGAEYKRSISTDKKSMAAEIAGIMTVDKTLDSPFILLKCFNTYKGVQQNPDHLLWIKDNIKDIVSWKLLTMINEEFYYSYTIEDKKEGILIDLNFDDEFYVDGFFVELSISGLFKTKPELGEPYSVVDSKTGIPKTSVDTKKIVKILEPGPAKSDFINCALYSLCNHYLYGKPIEYNETIIRNDKVLQIIKDGLEADNMQNTPVLIFIDIKFNLSNDEKNKILAELKELLPPLNVFGFTIGGDSFLIHSPAYVMNKISKFLRDLNEA